MERRERFFRIAAHILGGIGAALLVTILVLKILKFDIMVWSLPLVAVIILFLIADERARRLKEKRLKEQTPDGGASETSSEANENTLPNEAFEFEQTDRNEP